MREISYKDKRTSKIVTFNTFLNLFSIEMESERWTMKF